MAFSYLQEDYSMTQVRLACRMRSFPNFHLLPQTRKNMEETALKGHVTREKSGSSTLPAHKKQGH